ncbi:hypothetical protein [Parasphingorhabdus sp.]|uniref:hypothetical protein n=1 Tax=Parasphingorhabdus sp. TaxID=2709688 RepID=UPI0032631D3A
MLTRFQRIMFLNGLTICLIGLIGGFLLIFSILGGISLSPVPLVLDYQIPGTPAAWKAVHVGNIMNGLMAIIFALALPKLTLTRAAKKFVAYGTILTIWGNACFYVFGVFAPNRGLSLGDNSLGEGNWAGVLAFTPAFIGALVLIAVVIVMIKGISKDVAED